MMMMEVKVERAFIGVGCNIIVNNLSWGASHLASFGSQNAVAIFCPKIARILTTLPGRKASVNCTYWLPNAKFAYQAKEMERHYLLSGDADGAIILWEYSIVNKQWRHVLQVPQPQKKGVTCITSIMMSQEDAIFVSISSDGTVNVWELVFHALVKLSGSHLNCFISVLGF